MALLELNGANVGYNGRTVLKNLSLTIDAGERVALVGPSGVGKSTLLNQLHQQGNGRAALVPQDSALVRNLSVFHNVYMGRLNRHSSFYNLINLIRPMGREIAAITPILESFGLEDTFNEPVGELSGGQQQRTAVARALFQGGDVLLGDEPVSAVDVHQARHILKSINESFSTVVLAMHDISLAIAFTDRIVALRDGEIVMDRPTAGMTPEDLDPVYHRDDPLPLP